MNFFNRKRPQPPATVSTDEVIPLHYLDDQWHNRQMLLNVICRFDDVLDADKLKRALESLLGMKGWRKLGARVRLNGKGKLDYHVPARYDEKRLPFLWHHEHHHQSIETHSLAARLPRAKEQPTVFCDADDFDALCHPDRSMTIEDWLYTDKPVLSVSVWTFTDATLLTIGFSHSLLDIPGLKALLEAWKAVLEGHEDQVLPFTGVKEDPIAAVVDKTPAHKYILADRVLHSWGFLLFVFYAIAEIIFHRKKSMRIVQIPDSYLQSLKKQAREDLQIEKATDAAPFLSDGDVLFAWWAKLTISCLRPSPRRTMNMLNVMGLRSTLEDVVPREGAYIGNLALTSNTYMPAQQLLSQSLGATALQIRKDLLQQRTREQVEACLTLHKQHNEKKGRMPLFGSYDQVMLSLSNWQQARMFELDLSSAVVQQGCSGDNRGRPSLVLANGRENGFDIRNGGPLLGRDAAGNWWLEWALRSEAWPLVEEKINAWAAKGLQ